MRRKIWIGVDEQEWVTYSRSCGFNIIKAPDEEAAILQYDDAVVLDKVEEFDPVIVARIRELIES